MYRDGYGVTKDIQKAMEWLRKSAEQGNDLGQRNLNNLLATNAYSEAVKYYGQKEYSKALPLFKQTAEQNNADAQSYLGVMYQYGYGVPKDDQKAVEWYRKAAEQGNAYSQNNLGKMYRDGYGVPKDDQKAVEWYRKAAEQGNANGQSELGTAYIHGRGVTKDVQKAMEWYLKAAEQGNLMAQYMLAVAYSSGDEGITKNETQATFWGRKVVNAAEQGNATAQSHLGYMYQYGYGVAQDYQKAMEWYRKSDGQGISSHGQNNLAANIYREAVKYYGQKEYNKALPLFKQVAEFGNTDAQNFLGLMYQNGEGVIKDNQKAVEWYRKAAEQGNTVAQANLKRMSGLFSRFFN